MTKDELKDYLVDQAMYDFDKVEQMDEYELIDKYLIYEGIIGSTDDVIDTVRRVYGDLKDEEE